MEQKQHITVEVGREPTVISAGNTFVTLDLGDTVLTLRAPASGRQLVARAIAPEPSQVPA